MENEILFQVRSNVMSAVINNDDPLKLARFLVGTGEWIKNNKEVLK